MNLRQKISHSQNKRVSEFKPKVKKMFGSFFSGISINEPLQQSKNLNFIDVNNVISKIKAPAEEELKIESDSKSVSSRPGEEENKESNMNILEESDAFNMAKRKIENNDQYLEPCHK